MLKRVSYRDGLYSFWIERKEDRYVAYASFHHAMLGVASPSLMYHLGQDGLRAAYWSV